MKKKSFTIPFRSNFFKEQDPFHLVIIFFIIFFGTAIFFQYLHSMIIKNTTKRLKIQLTKILNLKYTI